MNRYPGMRERSWGTLKTRGLRLEITLTHLGRIPGI